MIVRSSVPDRLLPAEGRFLKRGPDSRPCASPVVMMMRSPRASRARAPPASRASARLGRRGEFHPGAAERRTVHVPAPAAGDDGGQRLCSCPESAASGSWPSRRAGMGARACRFRAPALATQARRWAAECFAWQSKPSSVVVSPGSILMSPTSSSVDFSARKRERARDVHHPQRSRRIHVVGDGVSARTWTKSPACGRRWPSQVLASDQLPLFAVGIEDHRLGGERAGSEQANGK